jgi:YegS/Rv2252/BmrU family lipid kinase
MLVIANPAAGRGRHAVLPRLRRALDTLGLAHQVEVTRGPGHAIELAAAAVTDRGLRYVVAVGGDGTVHEVVNGLVDADSGTPRGSDTVLAVVAGGSGCDFIRTFGLDRAPETVARHLTGEVVQRIDLGRVRYLAPDGTTRTRVFANIAEAGWGAEVTRRANRLPRIIGPSRYVAAILLTSRSMRQVPTRVTVAHTEVTEPLTEVVVANGQFFGGNLKVAPRALPDDGSFNVQTWRVRPAHVLRELPRVRLGEHLDSPEIREWQSPTVAVEGQGDPLLVEADGEILGTTPASFDVLDGVLRLKI